MGVGWGGVGRQRAGGDGHNLDDLFHDVRCAPALSHAAAAWNACDTLPYGPGLQGGFSAGAKQAFPAPPVPWVRGGALRWHGRCVCEQRGRAFLTSLLVISADLRLVVLDN